MATAVTFALSGDAAAPVAVPPNSVAVIDPGTNEVVAAVPVGTSPGPIVAGLDAVWVFNRSDFTVSKLDPARREVVSVLAGVSQQAGARESTTVALLAAAEGGLWTGHAALLRWSPPHGGGEPRLLEIIDILGPWQTGWTGIAGGLGRIWLTTYDARLMRVDPIPVRVEDVVELAPRDEESDGIAVPATDSRFVWVALGASRGSSTVFRYDPVGGRVSRTRVDGSASAIAADGDAVWIADAAGDELVRIRPDPLSVEASIAVGKDPVGVALGAGAVWTANAGDGTVSRVDPATEEVVTIHVGNRPQGIAFANGLVWVSVRSG